MVRKSSAGTATHHWLDGRRFESQVKERVAQIPFTERSKASVCGRSLAGTAGSNPAGCMKYLCCVCCTVRTKVKTQDNQDAETNTDKVQRENKKTKKRHMGSRFLNLSRPSLGPIHISVQWVPFYFQGVKQPWRDANHPPPSSAEVKVKVELYLYSPSGLSWPVLG